MGVRHRIGDDLTVVICRLVATHYIMKVRLLMLTRYRQDQLFLANDHNCSLLRTFLRRFRGTFIFRQVQFNRLEVNYLCRSAINNARNSSAIHVDLRLLLRLQEARARRHGRNGSLNTIIRNNVRTLGRRQPIHNNRTAVRHHRIILITYVLRHAIKGRTNVTHVRDVMGRQRCGIGVPFTPILACRTQKRLQDERQENDRYLTMKICRFNGRVNRFNCLITARLAPLRVGQEIFLFTEIVAVLLLRLLRRFQVVTMVPYDMFAILRGTMTEPRNDEGRRVRGAIMISNGTIRAFRFTVNLSFLLSRLASFKRYQTGRFMVTCMNNDIYRTLTIAIRARPFKVFFRCFIAIIFRVRNP